MKDLSKVKAEIDKVEKAYENYKSKVDKLNAKLDNIPTSTIQIIDGKLYEIDRLVYPKYPSDTGLNYKIIERPVEELTL